MPGEEVICKGLVERIGLNESEIHYKSSNGNLSETKAILSHEEGLNAITKLLMHPEIGVLKNTEDIDAVSHRVVHGGNRFDQPTQIDQDVLAEIDRLSSLAPLHNPANIKGIKLARSFFNTAKQVAIFDTAFHQTLPEKAYRYAIPKSMADQHKIRVYGFHGTSHKYVTEKAIQHLQVTSSKIISIHLGNGCSMTAVKDGKSIDHSLGFSPTNGLVMGTRSGDIDHSIIFYLMDSLQMPADEVNQLLQKQSGLLGLTGYSDLREIQEKAEQGDRDCKLALNITAYRIKKFIGSYIAALNGLDAIIFTAGIGENSKVLRSMVCENLESLGISIDTEKNNQIGSNIYEIQKAEAQVKVLVVSTDEEIEIAKQTYDLLK